MDAACFGDMWLKELQDDLVKWWRETPDKVLFLIPLVAWVALFQFWGNPTFGYVKSPSLFRWVHYVYTTSSDAEYGLYIPFVVLLLLIWKRRELTRIPKGTWWPGLLLVGSALALHIVGFLAQQTRISVLAFCLGLYGLTGLVWGKAWLGATFFPMFLLVFCVPLAPMTDLITVPLRLLTTMVSVGFGHEVLGIGVVRKGTQILDANGTQLYDVAPACSGIRSLISMGVLMTVYAFITLETWWKRLLIVAAAVPVALAGNILRITIVILVGEAFGTKAGATIEQQLGFVTFGVAIVCMLAMGHWLRERQGSEAGRPGASLP